MAILSVSTFALSANINALSSIISGPIGVPFFDSSASSQVVNSALAQEEVIEEDGGGGDTDLIIFKKELQAVRLMNKEAIISF